MLLTKIKNRFSYRRCAAILGLGLLITINLTGVLSAQSVTRAYGSDQVLQRGMIVGTVKDSPGKVEPVNYNQFSSLLGVVVNQNDSPITISDNSQHIFVTTSGRYDVLVSDQDGSINQSDYITLSAINGIGMKAGSEQSTVLGRAANKFDGKTGVLSTTELANSKGEKTTVHIGRISVIINISKNPLNKVDDGAPAILSRAGRAIAGKKVSAIRLYLGAIVFITGTIIAGAIVYAGIRSSIVAIGRNPLTRRSILKSMIGVAFTSLIIFLISSVGVYLLLKI